MRATCTATQHGALSVCTVACAVISYGLIRPVFEESIRIGSHVAAEQLRLRRRRNLAGSSPLFALKLFRNVHFDRPALRPIPLRSALSPLPCRRPRPPSARNPHPPHPASPRPPLPPLVHTRPHPHPLAHPPPLPSPRRPP